jgi:hypothetical protein
MESKMKYKILFIALLVMICGCLPGGDILNQVLNEMGKKYSERVSVSIRDGEYLTISLINSKNNKLNNNEKEKYASEIAFYIFDEVLQKKQFKEISIKFKTQVNAVVVQSTRTIAEFNFAIVNIENVEKIIRIKNNPD